MSEYEYGPEDVQTPPEYKPKFTFESGHFYQDGIEIPRWALTDAEMKKYFPKILQAEVARAVKIKCFLCESEVNTRDVRNWKVHMEGEHPDFVASMTTDWPGLTVYIDAWNHFQNRRTGVKNASIDRR